MRFLSKIFFLFFLIFSAPLYAYTEHIAAPLEDIWKASQEALKPYGILKSDEKNSILESRWIQEKVTREHHLFITALKKDYWRRMRIRVRLKKTEYSTRIEVRGSYQYRAVDAPWHGVWRPLKVTGQDRERERDFFFKILRQLEQDKLSKAL
ncbi:MAG: hypothetical protein HYZ84_05165 [Candidatus Omnitrophica bacterium]|nr:hypothetical protein [Candidatus Omnitrophota bacterium]